MTPATLAPAETATGIHGLPAGACDDQHTAGAAALRPAGLRSRIFVARANFADHMARGRFRAAGTVRRALGLPPRECGAEGSR